MTRRMFSKLLKPAAIVSSVLSAGVVLSLPAVAQTSTTTTETNQEIELSPEAFEILCERSPLNSRCEGGATEARDTTTIDQDRFDERIDPTESDPADAASDPETAPVDRDETNMSEPTYQTQPGTTTDEGTVAPKQSGETDPSDAASPSSTTAEPVAPEAETSAPAASISEAELQQFAEAVPQIQAIERSTQQEVAQTIDDSGISRERFSQLYQQQTSGSAIQPSPTEEEQESFAQAYSSIQKIQQDALAEREQVISAQGLEPQRFDQILAAVLQDPALQQQVQTMMAQ